MIGLFRFYLLTHLTKRSARQGAFRRARLRATKLLETAENFRDDWNYGNAIHHGHLVLGEVALSENDRETAIRELLAAANTPGSPQLDTFGPNMRLARSLVLAGETDAVFQYLASCRRFWKMGTEQLDAWSSEIRRGAVPEFGPNLSY